MVRYPIARAELIARIQALRPDWIRRARQRTDAYAAARRYTGGSDFWGEIKAVYIHLQHEKCAYCETRLQGATLASKVHEVEHFRPKGSVRAWPDRRLAHLADFHPPGPMGAASATGYFQLAYHPFNYAIACTRCNSTLKSSYFPVRGRRDVRGADPSRLQGERALLVYPLSDIDTDPRRIIAFDGLLAVPAQAAGPDHARGMTTIRFFQLNHEDLTLRRAGILVPLWLNLQFLAARPAPATARLLRGSIDHACAERGEFSACMRAFRERFETDRPAADRMGARAQALVMDGGAALGPGSGSGSGRR